MKKTFKVILGNTPFLGKYVKNNAISGIENGLFILNFIVQRIFRINSHLKIQVHYTSKIVGKNLSYHLDRNTILSFAVSGSVYIQSLNGVELGGNIMFAPGVKIISANHNKEKRRDSDLAQPIVIGENVWLGTNVVILPGVEIAKNSIIGAGSIVTKSFLEEGSVIVGNPAKKIN